MPTARYAPGHGRTGAAHPQTGGKAPHRRRSSGVGGANDGGPLADPVPVEEFSPPAWRTVFNSRADLGYPDFYPSRPGFGQPEDELTEQFVKQGFAFKPPVNATAESFSMHGPVYQQLQAGGLDKLMELGQEIITQRNASMPAFSERSFRIPVRVTYNDTKRLQFLTDLANPAIPLTRLMRNPVPHGFKGVDLLDTMFSPPQPRVTGIAAAAKPQAPAEPIPLDRALWFIRVLGANEISAHRGRAQPTVAAVQAPSPVAATPSSTATAPQAAAPPQNSNDWYTSEFTNAFTAWLRIQLGHLVLPAKGGKPAATSAANTPAAPPGPPKAPTGVLGDDKSRARWLAKWQYSNALLRELYRKRLIASRLLVSWLADFLGSANLAQLGFVTQLLHESLAYVSEYAYIGRHCVRAACAKIEEIRASPAKEALTKVEEQLSSIVRILYDADPEVLLSPTTWTRHSALLGTLVDSNTPTFKELGRRNDALVFKPVAVDTSTSPRRQQMADIQKLDSISAETDMAALCKSYFNGSCAPNSAKIDIEKFEEKVSIALNWAMGLYQMGIHRPYAVYTLFKKWLDWHEDYRPDDHFDFFPILYKWLDTSLAAQRADNVLAIGISFGELTRQGLFSYGRYMKTLIACGHSARFNTNAEKPSHHLALLNAMPIFVEASDLLEQRRLVISGDGEQRERDQMEEDLALDTYRQEVKEYVPELFGLKRYGRSALIRESIDYALPSAAGITRFQFVHSRFWLFAAAMRIFKRNGSQPAMDASTYARVMNIFQQCRGYSTLADFIVRGITGTEDEEILLVIIDSIKGDAHVWTSIDRWNQITTALMERFRSMQRQGRFFAPLATLLLQIARQGRLPTASESEVRAATERQRPESPPTPAFTVDMDQSMEGLKQIISKGDSARAVTLAPKLFTRHGKFSAWSSAWWTTIIAGVQAGDPGSSSSAAAAVAHVGEVDDHAGDGSLSSVLSDWLESLTPATRVDLFGRRNVPPVVRFLLLLVVSRRIGSLALFERLIFPELKHAASVVAAPHPRLSSKRTHAIEWAVTMAQQLLLCGPHKSLAPANLREAYIVQTARATVFSKANVEGLIQHLPVLVVLEHSKVVPEKTRALISNIFRGLSVLPQFKTAAFRNLDVLKDAFLSNDWIRKTSDSSLESGMVEHLKLIMSDSVSSSSSISGLDRGVRYSAWRWTRIVLEMRVEFKRLTMRIANNEEPVEARQALSRLVRSSLDREASTDDVDLLVEAFRGADLVVAQEILSVGLDRLGVLLSHLLSAEDQHTVEKTALAIDLVLRVIGSATRQERLDPTTTAARDRLFSLLTVAFQSLERRISPEEEMQLLPGAKPADPGDVLKVVLRLLRFVLAVPPAETQLPTAPKPDYAALAVAVLHLAVAICGASPAHNDLDSIRDLLIYLVDSTPPSSSSSVYQALLFETSTERVQDLVSRYPAFSSALPRAAQTFRAMALSGSHVLVDDVGIALDDRPWEMIEQMVTVPVQRHPDLFLASKALKDTASIPIALFRPQLTRDEVPEAVEDDSRPWENSAAERNLGNGFAGEPVAARQTATILFARDDGSAVADEETLTVSMPAVPAKVRRLSTRIPVSAGKQTGTVVDPIAIDSDDGSDEEEEEDTARPAAKRPRTSSKSVGGRQVTGGKAPRKTSGAVSAGQTGRKATAAKGVRSVSGKDVKGRRKS
ncbi:hypothetical protein VHUM_01585 [Vanrija humicola]|uniref:Mediator of RNA polymerase II transcription subunit 12 n=1 Tax=Vanrija humicola TaxID=5417 RepID=A0A7D8V0X3_VANHU|nr:hypothetical protein VHUM_01585 [Vanrija humicola]